MPIAIPLPSRLGDIISAPGLGALAGVALGAFSGEYVGTLLQSVSKQVGWLGLAVKAIGKIIISALFFYFGGRLAGAAQIFAYVAGTVSSGTILLDVINVWFPGGGIAAGHLTALAIRPKAAPPIGAGAKPTAEEAIAYGH